jgi:hypothetical protein
MSIVQTVIGAIASSGGSPPPTATYTLTPAANSVDEGASVTFTVGGTDIPDGTYYWTIADGSWAMADFSTINGSVSVTGNSGTFSVTTTADDTTEGSETFNVTLRSVSISGTILATSSSVIINDTSLTPVAPFSLDFPAGNPYLLVSNTQSDWNLGTTYTIEYWSKQTNASTSNVRTVMSQGPSSGKIDMGYMFGNLLWNDSQSLTPEPTAAVWTHVAWVRESGSGNITLYYNGVNQTTFNAGPALTDGESDLNIGRRAGINGQGFYGKLAMIRVSTTAKYLADFNPTVTYGVEADTRMMLGSNTPLVDTSASAHTITNTGVTRSMDFPTPPTYTVTPEFDNVDEGASLTFTVGGTNINNGTYYWTVNGSGDFDTVDGTVTITSNTGSFTVTPTADATTEGAETFTARLRLGSITGTILATSEVVTINDTSLDPPVPPFSLQFVNSENDYLDVAQPSYTVLGSEGGYVWSGGINSVSIFKGDYPEPQIGWTAIGQQISPRPPYQVTLTGVTDGGATWDLTWATQTADNLYKGGGWSLYDPALAAFNLGSTWTMEFWLKANASSDTAPGGIWGLLNQEGWSTTNAIVVALSDNKLVFLSGSGANDDVRYVEPTPGQWTHVAIANDEGTQTVWYNGVEQTKVSGTFGSASYTNGIAPLRIGRLGPQNGGTLSGKMAMVRISNTAKYATAFTATTTYGVEVDTKLFLSSDTPTVDSMSLTVTNNGVTTSTDFPT